MKSIIRYRFVQSGWWILWLSVSLLVKGDQAELHLECAKNLGFLAPADASAHRQYAPDREVAIQHLILDVTPDFVKQTIHGQATLKFKPIAQPCPVLKLDAVDLRIEKISSTHRIAAWQVTDQQVLVTFAQPIPADEEASVTLDYWAEPRHGLYFRTPEMGYQEGDTHLFTQGEAILARHWYPCYDYPNAKLTSEIVCRVPEGMTVLSNGRLISSEKDPQTGLVAVRWRQEKPHVNYLISLLAGYFKKIEDRYRDIPMAFYTPASQINEAQNSFQDTKDMMAFFEEEIGVPYPWVKYDQVCVNDFVAGGMENTSITTLTDYTLFTTNTENIRTSQGLVAHELAHQWFGDLITCKDWSHLWLNEGFATYYGHLYDGHKDGPEQLLSDQYHDAQRIFSMANDTKPIVNKHYDHPDAMFGLLAYQKGGWILHMLRHQLGPDLYRRCIKTFLERHAYDTVVTEDLNAVIEELSGRSFDQFFDQWVYHAHYPELDVQYQWDETTKLAKISVQQNQKLSAEVLLFRFPLTVRFKGKSGVVNQTVNVSEKKEDFYFKLNAAPEVVRIDPEYALLAKINFKPPHPMLKVQLVDEKDMIGRLLAVEQLAQRKDREAVQLLQERLNQDPFYGVRLEASKALSGIHSEEAHAALLASLKQSDARVRLRVVQDLGAFYRESSFDALAQVLETEKNPDIQAAALSALAAYGKPQVREILVRFMKTPSYRHGLADAAIRAMRAQNDPGYVTPLLDYLTRAETEFTSRGFAAALGTLAYLNRHADNKDAVREWIAQKVQSPKPRVKQAAIAALGALEDPKAIALLETFTHAIRESPERTAAEQALATLRGAKKPADDLRDLRNEVLELQKTSRELRQQVEDLKKKLEAVQPKPAPAKSTNEPVFIKL